MSEEKKKVAVIGAGLSGLAAIKSCLEDGMDPVAFEQNDDIGGTFYYANESRENSGATVYHSLITNTSKALTAFSDFPFPAESPNFLTHSMYLAYLKRYTEHFKLRKHIKFNSRIMSVLKARDYDESGNWQLEVKCENIVTSHVFNAVVICTGRFKKRVIPEVKGMASFKGDVIHSGDYKDGATFANKTVLVVGDKFSAVDLAADIAGHAKQTFLSVKRRFVVTSRIGRDGWPYDFLLNRFFSYAPIAYQLRILTKSLHLDSFVNHPNYGVNLSSDSPTLVINGRFGHYVNCGLLNIKSKLVCVGESSAVFEDGSKVDNVDAIAFATGFDIDYSFLDKTIPTETEADLELYRLILPFRLTHTSLAFVGTLGANSALTTVFEIQARWASRAISGRLALPSVNVMQLDAEQRRKENTLPDGRVKYFFYAYPYQDLLAADLGVLPSFLWLCLTKPALAYKYVFGPNVSFFYRLQGPAKWDGAEKAINMVYHDALLGNKGVIS